MTTQQTDVSDLAVLGSSGQQWRLGTPQDGVDDRIELTRLSTPGRIAIRDARYPSGPALLFDLPDWHALIGQRPDLVDLR